MAPEQSTREGDFLLAALHSQRAHVLGAFDGLPDEALRRPVLPSGWTCLGLVQHLALDVERFWFRAVSAGESVDLKSGDAAWQVGPDVPGGRGVRPLPAGGRARRRRHRRHVPRRRAGLVASRPLRHAAAGGPPADHPRRDHRKLGELGRRGDRGSPRFTADGSTAAPFSSSGCRAASFCRSARCRRPTPPPRCPRGCTG